MKTGSDIHEVAVYCGAEVAAELRARLPGIDLQVPKTDRGRPPLDRLTAKTRAAIVENFGGEKLYIPSSRPTFEETAAKIEPLIEAGLTAQQVALKLGVTEAWVRRCRRKAGAPKISEIRDPRQNDLFD